MAILPMIHGPEDVKALSLEQCSELAVELRQTIIDTVSRQGGHLASNLGDVELTIALHRAFDSPKDKLIFDVGHQIYAHKLLTGRQERFSTLRSYGGISGFPCRAESEHDLFDTGHSSTAISMASKRIVGARQALYLIRRAERVSSLLNDVVGDIVGIVAGSAGSVIAVYLAQAFGLRSVLASLLMTASISAFMIGGKAYGKGLAIQYSDRIVHFVGRLMALFGGKSGRKPAAGKKKQRRGDHAAGPAKGTSSRERV